MQDLNDELMLLMKRTFEARIADLNLRTDNALILLIAVDEIVGAESQAAAAGKALGSNLGASPV